MLWGVYFIVSFLLFISIDSIKVTIALQIVWLFLIYIVGVFRWRNRVDLFQCPRCKNRCEISDIDNDERRRVQRYCESCKVNYYLGTFESNDYG